MQVEKFRHLRRGVDINGNDAAWSAAGALPHEQISEIDVLGESGDQPRGRGVEIALDSSRTNRFRKSTWPLARCAS